MIRAEAREPCGTIAGVRSRPSRGGTVHRRHPRWKGDATTKLEIAPPGADMKALVLSDGGGFRAVLRETMQVALEAAITKLL
jgi:hypothetical protein